MTKCTAGGRDFKGRPGCSWLRVELFCNFLLESDFHSRTEIGTISTVVAKYWYLSVKRYQEVPCTRTHTHRLLTVQFSISNVRKLEKKICKVRGKQR